MTATHYIRIVAVLFILSGFGAIWTTISQLFLGSLTLGTGVLNLFVGIGLLRTRPFWRKVAMVMLAVGLVLTPIVVVAMIMFSSTPVMWFDTSLTGAARHAAAFAIAAFLMMAAGVQLWVLCRRDVKAVFEPRLSIRARVDAEGSWESVLSRLRHQ